MTIEAGEGRTRRRPALRGGASREMQGKPRIAIISHGAASHAAAKRRSRREEAGAKPSGKWYRREKPSAANDLDRHIKAPRLDLTGCLRRAESELSGDKKLAEPEMAPCTPPGRLAIPILEPEDAPPCSLPQAEQRGLI
jgi:hypothetical protein